MLVIEKPLKTLFKYAEQKRRDLFSYGTRMGNFNKTLVVERTFAWRTIFTIIQNSPSERVWT